MLDKALAGDPYRVKDYLSVYLGFNRHEDVYPRLQMLLPLTIHNTG